ncbi:MAG: metal-sulfur cluster assembly factor [Bdellovibrionota bacterium]
MISPSDSDVRDALRRVVDPELGVNIVDLGLVERIDLSGGKVHVSLGMTSPACPVGPYLQDQAKAVLQMLPGGQGAEVELLRDFHWSPDRMNEAARRELGIAPVPPPPPAVQILPAQKVHWRRLPLLVAAMISLLAGLWAGLVRLGWHWSIPKADWVLIHGPLMVCAFLGTLIAVERAVGLGERSGFIAPGLGALGAFSLLALPSLFIGPLFLTAASVGLFLLLGNLALKNPSADSILLALGTACWIGGNALWLLGAGIPKALPWWMAFLAVTIAAERLELTRFSTPSATSQKMLVNVVALLLASGFLLSANYQQRPWLLGLSFIALSAWLFRCDVATRIVGKKTGLPRFTAVCLLAGYVWLGFSGVLLLFLQALSAGPLYDAALHSFFVGFVFSMIFGHALIIFPSVLGKSIDFSKAFYVPLGFLHLSLTLRMLGDLLPLWPLRLSGGLGNGIAILFFFATMIRAANKKTAPTPAKA